MVASLRVLRFNAGDDLPRFNLVVDPFEVGEESGTRNFELGFDRCGDGLVFHPSIVSSASECATVRMIDVSSSSHSEAPATLIAGPEWRARAAAHAKRADGMTRDHVARRSRGETHPVEDFLFTYYNLKPAQLRRWHPGAGVRLEGAAGDAERSAWRWYAVRGDDLEVDVAGFYAKRGATVDFIRMLLQQTRDRAPSYGCFGLHEWAMVYRLSEDEVRHRGLPLRLGTTATDRVVERHPIRCTHIDAFRFFTPEAVPLNEVQPTRQAQPEMEQPGCLHAGMDIYKWTMKLGPLVSGELLLDTFELARDIRVVDMQASPYDVSTLGLDAIRIETPEGKSEYAALQRGFTERGQRLRDRVLAALEAVYSRVSASTMTSRL